MLTAVCMNPCFDKTVEVDAMTVGEVNRIRASRVDPGGKGVNVALASRRLGVEAACIGCMGKDGADRLGRMLNEAGLSHRFLTVPGEVRTNLKVVSRDGQAVTELNEPGAALDKEALQAFFALAQEETTLSACVVVTGSVPPGCPEGVYRQLMEAVSARCVLDVGGRELVLGCAAHPFLIKPNKPELEQTLGRTLNSDAQIVEAARIFIDLGAQHVLVSLGGDGALLVTPDKAYRAPAIPVKVRSTVGAGDCMVAGFVAGMEKTGDLLESFRWGVAAGTASVMTEGTQLIRREDFDHLLPLVTIQEI